MKVTRLDLDGTGSPLGLIGKILAAEPDLPIPVPIEELASSLDISEIQELTTDGFVGGLVTDEVRSFGGILVKKGLRRGRRRFTIGHELGHFLIPTHSLPTGGQFLCSSADMRKWAAREQDSAARFEVEANKFAAGILMPPPHFKKAVGKGQDPSLARIAELHDYFDVSQEAAARAYVNYHGATIAVAVLKGSKILRIYKPTAVSFPKMCVASGDDVPPSLRQQVAMPPGSISGVTRARAEGWLETEWGVAMPQLFQQVLFQEDGFAQVLLWCDLPDADDEFDPDADKTAKQRYKEQVANADPFSRGGR